MTNRNYGIWILILGLALLGLGVYFVNKKSATGPVTVEPGTINPAPTGDVACHENAKFFVVTKGSDAGETSFLVKNKTNSNTIPCIYTAASADFELPSLVASFYLNLTDNYLLVDQGTAPPPRALIANDLNTHQQVFTDKYSDAVEITKDVIKYWSPTTEKPTKANCPDLDQYVKNGLGAKILAHVSVDLTTQTKTLSSQRKCTATQ